MTKTLRITLALLLLAAVGLALAWWQGLHAGLDAVAAHRAPVAAGAAPGLRATWFGTTALLLDDGRSAVLIDPFFTRPPLWRVALNRGLVPDEAALRRWLDALPASRRLAAVLVSHSHYDHAMDAGLAARLYGAQLLGSESTLNIGRGAGLADAQLQRVVPDQVYRYGDFALRFVESRHAGASGGRPTGDIAQPLVPPATALDYRLGGTYSILVEHPLGNLLHHGSAGFVPGALRSRGLRADVVLLGVALVDALDPYLRETVDAVGATRLLPAHWDYFARPLEAPLQAMPFTVDLPALFRDAARLRPALRLQTLAPGQPLLLYPARAAG